MKPLVVAFGNLRPVEKSLFCYICGSLSALLVWEEFPPNPTGPLDVLVVLFI